MNKFGSRVIVVCLVLMNGLGPQAFAEPRLIPSFTDHLPPTSTASEYVFRNDQEETLIPVYLLGAVAKPGIYHIPLRTNIVTLLALSGGPIAQAEMESLTIKHRGDDPRDATTINFNKFMTKKEDAGAVLVKDDVIFLNAKTPVIDNNTMLTITFIGALASTILAGFAIAYQVRHP